MRQHALWLLLAAGGFGCGSSVIFGGSGGDGGGDTVGTGGATSVGSGGDATTTSTTTTTGVGGSGGRDGACADGVLEAEIGKKPADIILVVDNSGSMSDEINAVEQNINVNFANIIGASDVDYQVIMLTDHGWGSLDVCVGPPLSNTTSCAEQPAEVAGRFYHYDVSVQSWDSACVLLDTYYGINGGGTPDAWAVHPDGWSALLRQEAVKVFVEITDDHMECVWQTHIMHDNDTVSGGQNAALAFDDALLALAGNQFGSVAARNYLFYSIVGMIPNNPPTDPWEWFEEVQTTTCSTCVSPGTGYQWLSKGTKALRFPVSEHASYDSVFQHVAAGVIDVTTIPCSFPVPEAPMGEMLDLSSVSLVYEPAMGPSQTWSVVSGPMSCGPNGFYLDGDTVHLCPDTCASVESDATAKLRIEVLCI